MIITKKVAYSSIKKQLSKTDKIGIVSCNACARLCNTGGEKEARKLADLLKKDKFNVVDIDLIGGPCDLNKLQKSQLHGNVQIVMACDAGNYNLKKLFPKHKIISATETLGIGVYDGKKTALVRKVK